MTNQYDGDHNKEPKDFLKRAGYAQELSTIDPLPYFPNIVRQVRGPTNAMVLTYLEMIHPAPQDENEAILDRAVTIDCDQACQDIQVSRRTLHVALRCLGAWYLTEDLRGRAERAGRVFINTDHSLNGVIKCYSVVGSKDFLAAHNRIAIKRNLPHLNALFDRAGMPYLQCPVVSTLSATSRNVAKSGICATGRCASALAQMMPRWGDRRADRWDRWRRENGKKSRNPGRMRDAKKSVGSSDEAASD